MSSLHLLGLLMHQAGRNDLAAEYLRQALLVADHNAYHAGQIVQARRLLGAWRP